MSFNINPGALTQQTLEESPHYRMGGTEFTPARHELIESVWCGSMRHACTEPRLFVYYHKVEKTFVLAIWRIEPTETQPGLMMELQVLGGHPDGDGLPDGDNDKRFGRPSAQRIRKLIRLERVILREAEKVQEKTAREFANVQANNTKEREDWYRYVNKNVVHQRRDNPSFKRVLDGTTPFLTEEAFEFQKNNPLAGEIV